MTEDLNDILQNHGPKDGKAMLDAIIASQLQKKLNEARRRMKKKNRSMAQLARKSQHQSRSSALRHFQ